MNAKMADSYGATFMAFALGWAVFAFPWLSGSVTIPYDAKAHFQPQLQFLAHALHTGQSPFWTPNVFGGSPQIADPQSLIFSPALLIAYLDPAPSFGELDLYCFLLLALAGLSVIMLFKDRGWHPAGAIVAALATAFGGSAIWRIQHIKQIESFAFFILCFWLLARALDRKSLLWGILAGLAACMMIIEPGQVAMLGCYTLAGYTLNHWLTAPNSWRTVRQTLPPLLAGGAVAALLAATPILFSFLFVQDSNRPEIPFQEAARGALHPASLLTALIPNLYSVMGDAPYWGPGSIEWPANYLSMTENMGEVYIGALPVLALLALGIIRGRVWERQIRIFSVITSLLVIYALGRYTPIFRLLYDYLPGVDLFRRPADATYALGAMTAIVSGYFLHVFLRSEGKVDYRALSVTALLLGVAFAGSLGVAAAHDQLTAAIKPVLMAAAMFAAALILLLYLRKIAALNAALPVALLAAFMTGDLAIGNGPNRSTAKAPAYYEELRPNSNDGTIAFLKSHLVQGPHSLRRDRVELVGLGFEWPNASLIHNFDHVLGYNPLRLGAIEEGMGATETVAESWQRKFTPLFPSYNSLMADYLGLRYIASKKPIEEIDKRLKPGELQLVSHSGNVFIYENAKALPRFIFATDWMRADFNHLLKDGRWPVFDPMRTVLLSDPPPKKAPGLSMSVALTKAALTVDGYSNSEIEVEVESAKPGFLVLNDIWHPWWFGSVDGKPAEVVKANVLFRAIQVPAGKHTVRFEFRPIQGAIKEIEARLKSGNTAEQPRTGEGYPRPEASLQGVLPTAY